MEDEVPNVELVEAFLEGFTLKARAVRFDSSLLDRHMDPSNLDWMVNDVAELALKWVRPRLQPVQTGMLETGMQETLVQVSTQNRNQNHNNPNDNHKHHQKSNSNSNSNYNQDDNRWNSATGTYPRQNLNHGGLPLGNNDQSAPSVWAPDYASAREPAPAYAPNSAHAYTVAHAPRPAAYAPDPARAYAVYDPYPSYTPAYYMPAYTLAQAQARVYAPHYGMGY